MTAPVASDASSGGPVRPWWATPQHVRWYPEGAPVVHGDTARSRFVPYLTEEALADMLDGWVGPFNWSVAYRVDRGAVWADVTITDPDDGRAVTKTDCADTKSSSSSIEAASTRAFQRTLQRKWGIGREVRHLPVIVAPCRLVDDPTVDGGKRAIATRATHRFIGTYLADQGHSGWQGHAATASAAGTDRPEVPPVASGPRRGEDPTGADSATDPVDLPSPSDADWIPTHADDPDDIRAWIDEHGRTAGDDATVDDLMRIVVEILADLTDPAPPLEAVR